MGIENIWNIILDHHRQMTEHGFFLKHRMEQNKQLLLESIEAGLQQHFFSCKEIIHTLPGIEQDIIEGKVSPYHAAQQLLEKYFYKGK